MKAQKCEAVGSPVYWLASGTVSGRVVLAEGRNRGEAMRAWAAIAEARNVACLPPRRRFSIHHGELLP